MGGACPSWGFAKMSQSRDLYERLAIALSIKSTSDLQRQRGISSGATNDEIIAALGACRLSPFDFGPELIEHTVMGSSYSNRQLFNRAQLIVDRWLLAFQDECYPYGNQATRNVMSDRIDEARQAIYYAHAHHCRGREAGENWTLEACAIRAKVRISVFAEFVHVAEYVRIMVEGEAMERFKNAVYGGRKSAFVSQISINA